jgi:hypothetical protein
MIDNSEREFYESSKARKREIYTVEITTTLKVQDLYIIDIGFIYYVWLFGNARHR